MAIRWVLTVAGSIVLMLIGLAAAAMIAYTGWAIIDFDRPKRDAPIDVARGNALQDLGPEWPWSTSSIERSNTSLVARRTWLGLDERTVRFPCEAVTCDVPIYGDETSGPADHLQFAIVLAVPASLAGWAFRRTLQASRVSRRAGRGSREERAAA